MEIIAIVENRNVKIQDISVIGDNADYVIKFQFDEEWDGVTKTARFERRNGKYADVVLIEDSCEIPVQILKSDYIKIGVYSEKMTTTPTEINVIASVKDRSGIPEKPHYDVYAQLLEKIDKLKGYAGNVTDEQIREIVNDYMEENPGMSENKLQEVKNLLNEKISENKTGIAELNTELEKVKEKVGQAIANTIDTPFETAYWKDSETQKIYLVQVVKGVMKLTEYGATDEETGEDVSILEDLLTDRLLIWHDEFDGTEVDATKWGIGNCWGASDSRGDDPDNSCYQLSDSILRLCARPSNNTDITQKWYSSAIISKQKIRRGHVQAKIRVKSNKYTNNAYWLNAPDPWPVSGEVDMLETSGDTKFEGALHYGNADGSNGAYSAGTYPSTTDWFIAGIEIEEDVLKLYVNNEYYKDMDSDMANKFADWFMGVNPFANNPKSCIFDIAIMNKPTSHVDGDWESYIDIDYVRFYAPISSEDALNVENPKEITDFDIITLGNDVREVYFTDNGVKKLQAHAKFMLNIGTTPHTELTGYKASSDNTDVLKVCSKYDAVGFYSGKNGNANLTVTHSASGLSKVLSLEVDQNMNDKVSCEDYTLGTDNIGQGKFWIADLTTTVINKMVTNGKFKAKGNTTYQLNVSGGAYSYAYNSTYRNITVEEYDSSGNKLATTAFSSKDGTITTNENTAYVKLRAVYTDGSNFAMRDYFDMLANLTCINIVESGSEVEVVECTGITLDQTEITLDESTESVTLTATISPEDCTQEVVWSSHNNFVTVENGVVKGVTLGIDYVTATCGDYSETCTVNVAGLYNSEEEDLNSIASYLNDSTNWVAGSYSATGALESSTSRIVTTIPKELIEVGSKGFFIVDENENKMTIMLVKFGKDNGNGKYPDVSTMKGQNVIYKEITFSDNDADYSCTLSFKDASGVTLTSAQMIEGLANNTYRIVLA